MSDEAWNTGFIKSLGVRLVGDINDEVNERGELTAGNILFDSFLMLMIKEFLSPCAKTKVEHHWELMLDTADPEEIFAARNIGAFLRKKCQAHIGLMVAMGIT